MFRRRRRGWDGFCRWRGSAKPCQRESRAREMSKPKRRMIGISHRRWKLAMNCSVCVQIGTMMADDMVGFGEGFRRESVEEGRGYL